MKKNTVAVVGICAIAAIIIACLITGHNGSIPTAGFSLIGVIVGYVFGKVDDAARGGARTAAAALLCLGLASCGTTVEACYVHPEYGQVCVKYDGKLHVRADVSADPAKLKAVTEWLKEKGAEIE